MDIISHVLTYGAKGGAHVHNLKPQLWIAKKFPPQKNVKKEHQI